MRRLVCTILLAAGLLGVASATEYPNRLPHGTVIDRVEPRRARVDVSDAPVFVVERTDLAQGTAPARADAPPPPPIDQTPSTATEEELEAAAGEAGETDASQTVTLQEAVPEATEKVLPEARAVEDPPLPEKVRPSETISGEVTIRREGDNVIEEYRRSGSVYMVVVTPENGARYTYLDTDGDGRLEGDPREGRARPVYYTLYEWE